MDRETKDKMRGYEYCSKVMFPFLIRLRKHIDIIKQRLADGEKLEDIHADMRGKLR
ncbi:MAG: hypothetical protein KKA76_07640 [Proteobacteria bacterium]|nr:hypothetical protein [Pseudomonadota bacterium]